MELPKNIALVHDWLVSMRGGEKVLEILCELFPNATLFTLIHRRGEISPVIEKLNIKTSFIQRLPFSKDHYQYYLSLFPTAIEQFDMRDFDLVISSSHAVAKGVRARKDALHICYCHTPMRYIWDQHEQYFGKDTSSLTTRTGMRISLNYLRRWDIESSKRVNQFVANSRNVKERINRIYHRESEVIYPPVDVNRFRLSTKNEGYFLIVSALVPYKRIDLAVDAFNRIDKKLIIIGSGGEERKLREKANKNIEFLGWVSDNEIEKYYAGCCALIFPGEEDFGIVPVEAMASGKPVIAYGQGGALETVVDKKTGLFFHEPKTECLIDTIEIFNRISFDPQEIRNRAMKFDKIICQDNLKKFIQARWDTFS